MKRKYRVGILSAEDGILWLNPGGCGRKRFGLPVTRALMEIQDGRYSVKRADLEA